MPLCALPWTRHRLQVLRWTQSLVHLTCPMTMPFCADSAPSHSAEGGKKACRELQELGRGNRTTEMSFRPIHRLPRAALKESLALNPPGKEQGVEKNSGR